MSHDAQATAPTDAVIAELPVLRVLLTEDRAQVSRGASLSLAAGSSRLVVRGVSPLVVDATLQSSAAGPDGEWVVSQAAVRRRWVAVTRAARQSDRALAERARTLEQRVRRLEGALGRTEAGAAALSDELHLYARFLVRNALRNAFDAEQADRDLAAMRDRLFTSLDRARDLRADTWLARRDHAEVAEAIASLERGELELSAELHLGLEGPGGQVEIEVGYLVPNALWRPSYTASLRRSAEGDSLTIRVEATVWQRTEVDWTGVGLTLSTARPSVGAGLPPLHHDKLAVRDKTPEERRTVEAAFEDVAVQSTDRTGVGASLSALPGVDDGGEVQELRPEGVWQVPSDGRPHRVLVGEFTVPVQSRLLCVPELRPGVFRHVVLSNGFLNGGRPAPLLAGPVVLVVDGGYVGLGEIEYVAAGESFGLSFGTDDDLVVRYTRRKVVEERFARADLKWFIARAVLTNTGEAGRTVELCQRVPVSELDAVKVHIGDERTTSGTDGADKSGHVRWRATLGAGESKPFELAFRLEASGRIDLPDPW